MDINKEFISGKNTYTQKNAQKYIVIHETDNFKKGADGLRHAKAQYNGNLSTSVHYYCGSDGIYQVAELTACTWSVGINYNDKHSIKDATNFNTINIEICVNEDGNYEIARNNAIELTKYLMSLLNIAADRVIRHYDAKGKYCPRAMMDNPELWTSFKDSIKGKVETTTPAQPTPDKSEYKGNSIVDYLNSIGEASDFSARKKLAVKYGISNYKGTASQNLQLLSLMRSNSSVPSQPTVTTPTVTTPVTNYYPAFSGTSIVDGLKKIGVDSSKANRTKIAKANGISNYTGSASQNVKLLSLAKKGKLVKP